MGLGRVALGVVVIAVPLLLPPHGTPMEEPYWVREGELRCNGPADLDGQPQAEVGRLEPDVLQSDSIHDWMEPEQTGSDGFGEAKPQATMPESTCSRQTIRGHGDLREGRLVEGSCRQARRARVEMELLRRWREKAMLTAA